MNTKAVSVLLLIFEVMVVLLVGYIAFSIAQGYASSETVQKINLAEDLRLMLHTVTGVPGDALVQYPHDVSHFNFILTPNSITVFIPGEPEPNWVLRTLYLPVGYAAEGTLEQPASLCLEKKAKTITMHTCAENQP